MFILPALTGCEQDDPLDYYDTTTRADSTAADSSQWFTLRIDTTLEVYTHYNF